MLSESTNLPMEILLVEDGLLDARITIHALRRSGIRHRLTLVRTVQEAIDFLARRGVFARAPQPDLLLLDLTLPDGNGVEILDEMPALHADRSSRTHVVILSASDDDQTQRQCLELGVDDFIGKPVDEDKFLRVVRDHEHLMRFSDQDTMVGV